MVDVRLCVNGITFLGPTHPSEKFVVFSLAEGYSQHSDIRMLFKGEMFSYPRTLIISMVSNYLALLNTHFG